MITIVPQFKTIFDDFGTTLPPMTQVLIDISSILSTGYVGGSGDDPGRQVLPLPGWCFIPLVPFLFMWFIKIVRMNNYGAMGWDLFTLKMPIFGQLVEKNLVARCCRTLGTLLGAGVPILEGLNITKETTGNKMFEKMFTHVSDRIRDGEAIAQPMKDAAVPGYNLVAGMFWTIFVPGLGALLYMTKAKKPILDDLVVNMVDVGEESGELDTMLYKVADTYDEEVAVLTESLTSLMEPILIIFLGGAVGFIVVALLSNCRLSIELLVVILHVVDSCGCEFCTEFAATEPDPWKRAYKRPSSAMTSVFFLRLCMAGFAGCLDCAGLRVNKDFKDTDGDGWNEFVDAWGNPLSFILWPVGLQKPDGDNFFNATSSTDALTFGMRPFVFSAGPDGKYGIEMATSSPGIENLSRGANCGDPSQSDYTTLGSPSSTRDAADNLTNFDAEFRR